MSIWLLCSIAWAAPLTWREAVTADTSAAYRAYAAQNVGSPKAAVALRRAEERAWAEAEAANDSTAYRAYVQAFPTGEHVGEAATREIELAWDEASAGGALSGLVAFLERYPQSTHAPEARAKVEESWFQQAQAEATEAGWARFLGEYPRGARSAVAWGERDRLAWDKAVAGDTREAYHTYLEDVPDLVDIDGRRIAGAHRADADQWLAATTFRQLQPVVALVGTWQAEGTHAATLTQLTGALERALLPDLRKTFTVLPVRTIDATRGMDPPQQVFGTEAGTGLLVFEIRESVGREFEPEGHATDLGVVLRLYAPNTARPVLVRELTASTPDKVRGEKLDELHTTAVTELGDRLRVFAMELAAQAPQP